MLVIRQVLIFRSDLKANPDVLYVFGDNLERQGLGGQAKEMRGEVNSFGVATKRAITHGNRLDYFYDSDDDAKLTVEKDFNDLKSVLSSGPYKAVIVPADGIGTGLALLHENAPKLLEYINKQLETLKDI